MDIELHLKARDSEVPSYNNGQPQRLLLGKNKEGLLSQSSFLVLTPVVRGKNGLCYTIKN
eukprot:4592260-Ditylum_brightwellii.AAC.1